MKMMGPIRVSVMGKLGGFYTVEDLKCQFIFSLDLKKNATEPGYKRVQQHLEGSLQRNPRVATSRAPSKNSGQLHGWERC